MVGSRQKGGKRRIVSLPGRTEKRKGGKRSCQAQPTTLHCTRRSSNRHKEIIKRRKGRGKKGNFSTQSEKKRVALFFPLPCTNDVLHANNRDGKERRKKGKGGSKLLFYPPFP